MLNAKLALMHNLYSIMNNAALLKVIQPEKYSFALLLLAKFLHFIHLL